MARTRNSVRQLAVALSLLIASCRSASTSPELQSLVARADVPFGSVSKEAWADTAAFYTARGQAFAWVDSDGPTDDTAGALDVLQSAETHGLNPIDYSEPELRAQLHQFTARNDPSKSAARVAAFDVRLTASLLQLGRDVAVGRVPPETIDSRWNVRRDVPDLTAALQRATSEGVESFLASVAPRHPEYQALQRALSSLRGSSDPTDERVRQVAMNLERWRWLPDDLGTRHFIVNVPRFRLVARENGAPVLDIRVVVGKRGDETPLFSDQMEEVVFSPYWNIPETIALRETAPAVARDPEFLARNNIEVVDSRGRVVSADDVPWDDEGLSRGYRFRQRPGARNALGLVKFLFPNEHAVYLHDTPADALFNRIGRALSHGCIRVEEPETLAQYVLRDQPEWTAESIRAAMHAGQERQVRLKAPIPIHIVYMTAWVDDQGVLHFENDVYGYDVRQLTAESR